MILAPLQKFPNNVGNLGKMIVATSFELLPKVAPNRPIWSQWLEPTWNFEARMNWTIAGVFRVKMTSWSISRSSMKNLLLTDGSEVRQLSLRDDPHKMHVIAADSWGAENK